MGDLVMFPMTYASFEKGEHSVSIVWANSSGRMVNVVSDTDIDYEPQDFTIIISRLLREGWIQVGRGEVNEE